MYQNDYILKQRALGHCLPITATPPPPTHIFHKKNLIFIFIFILAAKVSYDHTYNHISYVHDISTGGRRELMVEPRNNGPLIIGKSRNNKCTKI